MNENYLDTDVKAVDVSSSASEFMFACLSNTHSHSCLCRDLYVPPKPQTGPSNTPLKMEDQTSRPHLAHEMHIIAFTM